MLLGAFVGLKKLETSNNNKCYLGTSVVRSNHCAWINQDHFKGLDVPCSYQDTPFLGDIANLAKYKK